VRAHCNPARFKWIRVPLFVRPNEDDLVKNLAVGLRISLSFDGVFQVFNAHSIVIKIA
jgi:hypothetical protein